MSSNRYFNIHPTNIAKELKQLFKENEKEFFVRLKELPDDITGDVILELPEKIKDKVYNTLSKDELVSAIEELETDDATDLIKDIEENNEQKAQELLNSLDPDEQEEIKWLKKYDNSKAGAFMQTELFQSSLDETIETARQRLKQLKLTNEVENIHQVFVVNENSTLVATISLEDLFIQDYNLTFEQIIAQKEFDKTLISVLADDEIQDVVKKFEQYDLSVVAVIGYKGRLLGRITSDDIYDVIEETATDQLYHLAGVNDDIESEEGFFAIGKQRALWLFLNLITAVLASIVIGIFDDTIANYVALAVLMPIVASMGGNAGTQTLTVMVRQLALGEVEISNAKEVILKEVYISLLNGLIFAFVAGLIALFWFNNSMLGVVIGLSMIINLFMAGFFGAVIPMMLKKYEIDPAIGSSVILTTITDIAGFFSFLALASYLLV